ncbi:GNAT family N-acetyltransferase [Streptomyces sp. NPDC091272]|uniref:GNAT family N-acetyltransferase n=1 Tax=Streptomyces sp. NPDC091272 TaxID=3365981 RepID=UPI00381A580D
MAAVAAEVFFRRLSRWQADQQRESIADLYELTYRESSLTPRRSNPYEPVPAPDSSFHDRAAFLARFAAAVQRPGFDLLIASTPTTLVGCVYGYLPDRQGSWWYGRHDIAPPEIGQLADSGRVFNIADLMVAPTHRRQKVAERLQERLLVRVDAELVTTLIEPANSAAKAAYEAWHWSRTGRIAAANGRPELEVWTRIPPG